MPSDIRKCILYDSIYVKLHKMKLTYSEACQWLLGKEGKNRKGRDGLKWE